MRARACVVAALLNWNAVTVFKRCSVPQNILMSDGLNDPEFRNINPARVDLRIDDGTGVVLTTPTVPTRLGGAPMAVAFEVVDDGNINGAITVGKAGTRTVRYSLSEITPVNNQVLTVEVFRQPLGGAAVSVGGRQLFTQPATAVAIPGMSGESPPFACGVGDIIDLRITGSTGNVTVRRANIVSQQWDG